MNLFAHLYLHMLDIAGQTTEPNWLNFFMPWVHGGYKKFMRFLIHGQRRALQ